MHSYRMRVFDVFVCIACSPLHFLSLLASVCFHVLFQPHSRKHELMKRALRDISIEFDDAKVSELAPTNTVS